MIGYENQEVGNWENRERITPPLSVIEEEAINTDNEDHPELAAKTAQVCTNAEFNEMQLHLQESKEKEKISKRDTRRRPMRRKQREGDGTDEAQKTNKREEGRGDDQEGRSREDPTPRERAREDHKRDQ